MAFFNYQPPMVPYLKIIYQDDDILVVDKPAWILSVRGRGDAHQDSIQKRVNTVFPQAYIVHRLDMATSGLMVLAMHKTASTNLGKQFAERNTHKIYYARVLGHPIEDEGVCDAPLIVDWPNRPKQKICYQTGKASLTHYRVISRDDKTSLVRLEPKTGRSHQLRVHMLSLGHPILGDRLYSSEASRIGIERMHLHAGELGLTHPATNDWLEFTSEHCFADEPASIQSIVF
jgi:tRNA pseudouridine32 synthase/23S rRNA pseudouridine746 synthase